MRPASAKAKGRKLQNEVRDRIKEKYGFEPDTAVMGEKGKDVKDPRLPYSIECKNVEKLNLWTAWRQAKDNLFEGDTPVVIFTKNRPPGQKAQEDRLAVVPLDWFLDRMDMNAQGGSKPVSYDSKKLIPISDLEVDDDDSVQQSSSRETASEDRSVPVEGHGRGESCDSGAGGCMVCRCLEASGWTRPGAREDS